MKRILALCLLVLFLMPAFTLATLGTTHAYDDTLEPITAYLKQKMALRSGPGTHYTELEPMASTRASCFTSRRATVPSHGV